MRRALYTSDHEAYRETVREFLAREVEPHFLRRETEHLIDRAVFAKAAEQGIYASTVPEGVRRCPREYDGARGVRRCPREYDGARGSTTVPEEYGGAGEPADGAGEPDYRYRMVACEETVRYCFERTAFDKAIGDFQNSRFLLAEMATELDVAEAYVDTCVRASHAGEPTPVDAAKGRWYVTELQKRITDQCVPLHGGYGYVLEYPVARAFIDSRMQTIYGGTTEIMKEIVGRDVAQRDRS